MRAGRRRARREGGHGSRESNEDENSEYALTEAYPALRLCLGGGEKGCTAASKTKTAMVRWRGCKATVEQS